MNSNMSNLPPTTPCLSSQEMLDYTQGILSPKEQHRIEKHLLDCEFCAEAMEGLAVMENPNELLNIEEELNFDVDAMVASEDDDQESNVKVLFPWRIAAAVALIFVSTLTLWLVLPKNNVQDLALENTKPYPAPADVASEPILENQEIKVLNEQSVPTSSKSNTPSVASREIMMEDAPMETSIAEKDIQSDEVYSTQAPTKAALSKEESVKKAEHESAPAQYKEPSTETKSKTETSLSEVAVASKTPTTRAASSSEVFQDAGTTVEVTDANKFNTDDFYKKGIKEYKNKKYAAAISYLEKCSDKPDARFYSGVSYFLLENPHLALSHLEKYIQTNQTSYREAAYWYSGLSHLKLENKAAAKQSFEKVLPFKGEFEKQAVEMLKSL